MKRLEELEGPVLRPPQTLATVTAKISDNVLERPYERSWLLAVAITMLLVMMLSYAVVWLIVEGVGIWGVNIPVAWGFAIANFVWWIGIGHAGTFISAMLLLMRQNWRTSINRFAEAMTLFAVMCAGMFPLFHVGRVWVVYWILPYPNQMKLWPQFRSPLVWDVFAVSTYFTVSLIFWYFGLIPDLATCRDRARTRIGRYLYGLFSLGWRGASRHWKRYMTAYLLLGGLACPLVVSVHSVVGMDFAAAIVPGWHTTIFPPYFVGGAIFSGFAMVLTLAIPIRAIYGVNSFITIKHIDNCCKLMLVTGLVVGYGYAAEFFMGWYSGVPSEWFMDMNRVTGPYAWAWGLVIFCNVVSPIPLWFRWVRQNVPLVFLIAILVQVGMWTERFMIVIGSLHRDFLPSSWGFYEPTIWDWATLLGTMGFFLLCFFLFLRYVPMIAMSEMRALVHSTDGGRHIPADFDPAYAE
jgi:molybdopterin-containing oxidoreductase family membrane subunit